MRSTELMDDLRRPIQQSRCKTSGWWATRTRLDQGSGAPCCFASIEYRTDPDEGGKILFPVPWLPWRRCALDRECQAPRWPREREVNGRKRNASLLFPGFPCETITTTAVEGLRGICLCVGSKGWMGRIKEGRGCTRHASPAAPIDTEVPGRRSGWCSRGSLTFAARIGGES